MYTLDLASGVVTRLTFSPEYDSAPSFSPDGLWLAYESYLDENLEIVIAPIDGGQPPIRLEVMGHTGSMADDGWYYVTGEVRNPHAFALKFPELVVTYYNAAHEVVRVEVDFAEVDPLEPGQSSAFEVILTDPPDGLMHYTLQTEAVEQ